MFVEEFWMHSFLYKALELLEKSVPKEASRVHLKKKVKLKSVSASTECARFINLKKKIHKNAHITRTYGT